MDLTAQPDRSPTTLRSPRSCNAGKLGALVLQFASVLVFIGLSAPATATPLGPTPTHPWVGPFAVEATDLGSEFLLQAEPGVSADTLAVVDSLPAPAAPSIPTEAEIRERPRKPPSPLALRGHGRPNPIKAIWKGARAGASDVIYLYTTPLRMRTSNFVSLGAVAGAGAALYAFDADIQEGFQRSREDPIFDAVVIQAGDFFAPLGLISATTLWLQGAAVAGWVLDVPLLRTIPVEILESNFIVGSLRQPIEKFVHRRRPSEGEGARSFTGGSSFPSGHASVVCETASILSHHARHPLARAVIWGAATTVCLQRVDHPGYNHWSSDVWFGAALGAYSGHTIAVRNEERRQGTRQREWYDILHRPAGNWSAVPVFGPGHSGFALRTKF